MIYKIAQTLAKICYRLVFGLRIFGAENLPKEGGALICANHISNFDPPAISAAISRKVRFLAKKELFKNRLFGKIILALGATPLDRGGMDTSAVRKSIAILKNNELLLLFPQGTRREDLKKEQFKDGAATLAVMANVPIVPVCIVGKYRPFGGLRVYIGQPISATVIREGIKEIGGGILIYERIRELYEKRH